MNERKKRFLTAALVCCCLCGCGDGNRTHLEEMQTEADAAVRTEYLPQESTEQTAPQQVYVYVCGAVQNPGVYELPEGSRVFEAVESAGGLREDACADALNQADKVVDGQMIKVPTTEEVLEKEAMPQEKEMAGGRLDINRATAEQFMTLPGIGQAKAEALVKYREAQGGFSSVEEIMNVEGIKEGVFQKIKDSIKV